MWRVCQSTSHTRMKVFAWVFVISAATATSSLRGLKSSSENATVFPEIADKEANCWDIGDERTCASVSDCYWDFRNACPDSPNAQARCWEFSDEATCAAKSDCYWDSRSSDGYGDKKCKRKNRRLQNCQKCRRKG